ncbi:MAG TPA: phosphopantetheine-binding protein [Actinoplanes sp.]|nr:phosphopantetheine-binding protein [Actinoplanes sp.]
MSQHPWPESFATTLRGYLPLLPTGQEITADMSLADHGLDSLSTVSLLLDLEESFLVTIPDHLLSESTFATPAELWAVIHSLSAEEPAR